MKKMTTAPNPTVWERIKLKQLEMNDLYREAIEDVFKETDGAAFLGEDNTAFATYWLAAVTEHPQVMDGLYNTPDFTVKEQIFKKLIVVYNDSNAGRAILDSPYNDLSKDIFRYAMDAKLKFDEVSERYATYKQVVRDAPQYRKPV